MKKAVCLLLAILMMGGMFAACGNAEKKETATGSGDPAGKPAEGMNVPALEWKACEPALEIALSLDGNDVIYDKDGIRITLTGVDTGAWEMACCFEVVNNSDKIIQLCGNYVKVNKQSTSLYVSEIIPSGKSGQEQMRFNVENFVEEPMEYLELTFSIMECASEDYQDYAGPLVEDVLAVYQAEDYNSEAYSFVPNGELVYEDTCLAIYFNRNPVVKSGYDVFPYTIVNKMDVPVYVDISSCEYTLNRYAQESKATCITAQNVLAPNSYMYDTIRVENWRDDIAPKDLTGAVFTLEGYLIDCSNEMEDVQFFDFTGNREEVRQSLPFHGKTFTVAFPENG